MNTKLALERKSSAVTLSDMELFVFPELLYALVLANLMSPRIWRWRSDPWFEGAEKLSAYRRITRLRQFIMDHYAFNLDLETWGLTTKERELARFHDFISEDILRQSNALFGYEGDKYYFDIDIRRHFGLDRYDGNVIPYWKTETVEAMDAFRHKHGYASGAGECVSLAALYAAALFVVARIPLEHIYLMCTPLHSQNFVDIDDGILTNNRRLVTKKMWFNGTVLSAQARRALENERVTVVAHVSGHIHTVYRAATIDPNVYRRFAARLRSFLKMPLSPALLVNYLRHNHAIQHCFQVRCTERGLDCYIPLETVFEYEHGSPYSLSDATRDRLLQDIDREEFQPAPLPQRIVLNDLEEYVRATRTNMDRAEDMERLVKACECQCLNAREAIEALRRFCHVEPRLPDPAEKTFVPETVLPIIDISNSREDIISHLEALRDSNETVNLAFYAYRDLNRTEADPFLLAAVERCPVSVVESAHLTWENLEDRVRSMPHESIYDEPGRVAQPDEVWNFGRGDGVEKALLLANIFRSRNPDIATTIEVSPNRARLNVGAGQLEFVSTKQLKPQMWKIPARDQVASIPSAIPC